MLTISKTKKPTIWMDIHEAREKCQSLNDNKYDDYTYQMEPLYTVTETHCRIKVLNENNNFIGYL